MKYYAVGIRHSGYYAGGAHGIYGTYFTRRGSKAAY
jgi:hypothetical protein